MAIDTATKRASTIAGGLEPLIVWPAPDGLVDAGDRAQSAGLYRAGPATPGATVTRFASTSLRRGPDPTRGTAAGA